MICSEWFSGQVKVSYTLKLEEKQRAVTFRIVPSKDESSILF